MDAKDLIEKDKSIVNVKGAGERTPLMRAVGAGHMEVAEFLIQSGAEIEATDKNGRVALHWACVAGHATAAKLLLEKGSKLNVQSKTGMTALHGAAMSGKLQCVQLLVGWSNEKCTDESGLEKLNLKAENGDGKTPEQLANDNKHAAIAAILKSGKLDGAADSGACVIS